MHPNQSLTVSRPAQPGKKYFTVVEANRALVYVSRVVEDVVDCYGCALELRQRIDAAEADERTDQLRDDYELAMDHLGELMDELQQVGVELKDVEMGLLDFPAFVGGREVCLCWQRGESQIHYWHEADAGYANRQDLASLEMEQDQPTG